MMMNKHKKGNNGGLKALGRNFRIHQVLFQRLKEPALRGRVAADLVLMALVSAALACFCVTKEGGLDLYMSTFLPMLGVLALFFVFTESLGSSRTFTFSVALLILTGLTLQILLMLPADPGQIVSAGTQVTHGVVSMVFAMAVLPVLRWMLTDVRRGLLIWALCAVMAAMYVFLLVFGESYNSTRAWISLGGFSFQMTEAIKVIALITFGLIFTDPGRTPTAA